ncbi:MAG: zf-HC2 domain-containing protein [Thermoleophilia bacterium]
MKASRTRQRGGRGGAAGSLTCFEARPLLSALVDGEVDDLQRARVERHLRSCTRCRDFRRFSSRTQTLVRGPRAASGLVPAPREHAHTAALLAIAVKASGRRRQRSDSWRSVVVGATLAAALSLGAVIGGLGVWTLTREAAEPEGLAVLTLPRVVASRTLDPGVVVEEPVSILTAWAPPRRVENTFDEKAMFWVTPMSHFERVHLLPEQL